MGSYTHMGAQCRVFWLEIRVFYGYISQGTSMCVIDMIRKLLEVIRISVGISILSCGMRYGFSM